MMTHNLPSTFTVGDTLTGEVISTDYPASKGWSLQYTINGPYTANAMATANGDNYALSIPSSTTSNWPAGDYFFSILVRLNNERHTLAQGPLKILPNLASGALVDARSHNRKMLDAIRAFQEKKATGEQMDILKSAFMGRSVERISTADLLSLEQQYQAKVTAEENVERIRQGLKTHNTLYTRFRNG